MPIDLFQEVMDHLACADRALSAPHWNDIILVGRSGVGRRSLVSLIAHMQRLTVFSPATSRKYDDKEWKRDLKQVMHMTGIERQHTVFFLEDHHMVKSAFLESINSLLSCGDVPGIWTPDELEPLLAPLKGEVNHVSRSRCCSGSDSFRVFRPPATQPHAYCVVHGYEPPTFPHFLRREPSSLQLLQRHVAGRLEREEHALSGPAAADRRVRLQEQ